MEKLVTPQPIISVPWFHALKPAWPPCDQVFSAALRWQRGIRPIMVGKYGCIAVRWFDDAAPQ